MLGAHPGGGHNSRRRVCPAAGVTWHHEHSCSFSSLLFVLSAEVPSPPRSRRSSIRLRDSQRRPSAVATPTCSADRSLGGTLAVRPTALTRGRQQSPQGGTMTGHTRANLGVRRTTGLRALYIAWN